MDESSTDSLPSLWLSKVSFQGFIKSLDNRENEGGSCDDKQWKTQIYASVESQKNPMCEFLSFV